MYDIECVCVYGGIYIPTGNIFLSYILMYTFTTNIAETMQTFE